MSSRPWRSLSAAVDSGTDAGGAGRRPSAGPPGRPAADGPRTIPGWQMAKALYKDRTHEVGAICHSLHISRSTLYRYLALPEG